MEKARVIVCYSAIKEIKISDQTTTLQVKIKKNIEVFMLNQFYAQTEPILLLKLSQFSLEQKQGKKEANFVAEISLKCKNSVVFEPLVEELKMEGKLLKSD